MNNIKKIYLNLSKKHLLLFCILICFLIVLSLLEVVSLASIPLLLNSILDQKNFDLFFLDFRFIENILLNISQADQIQYISIFIVFLFVFKNLVHGFVIYFQGQIVKNIKIFFSKKLFKFYLNQNYLRFIKKNSSILIRTLSVDVGNTTIYLLNLINLVKECLILLSVIILLFLSNTEVSILLFSIFLFAGLIFYYLNKKKLFRRGKIIQSLSSNIIKIIYEMVGLFKELKIYNLNAYHYKNYLKKVQEAERNVFLNYFVTSLPRLFLELIAVILIVLIIFIQLQSEKDVINILPFLSLIVVAALRLIPVFNSLTTSLSSLKSIQPSFDLIFSEFDKIRTANINANNVSFIKFNKKLILKDICFKYERGQKNTINNLTLDISKGDKIGFVGESGTGKSTLINIIMGLLKHSAGKIYIDGQEILKDTNQLIENIGYVPQEIFLFEDKLKKNIAIGFKDDEISKEKLLEASKAAQILKFINNLEKGFDTIVEENGRNFSVGQKQRIGVARALYRNPELLIFDESTSSLDKKTEEKFIEDVFSISEDKTIIFISHKMSALTKCDKIFDIKNNMFIKK